MARILLVEDFIATRCEYCSVLEQEGFHVDKAGNSTEALRSAQSTRYDLVCINMIMLEQGGFELIETFRLQAAFDDVRLIILSNVDRLNVLQRAAALGVDKYLIKSQCPPKQFVSEIREILEPAPSISLQAVRQSPH